MSARVLATLCLLVALSTPLVAETYRVGPGEEHATISEVVGNLKAGDVVEVTGDIFDHFTLTAHGTPEDPITIRGVTRIENGAVVRFLNRQIGQKNLAVEIASGRFQIE